MNILEKIKELRNGTLNPKQYLDSLLNVALISNESSKYTGTKLKELINNGIINIEKTKEDLLRDTEIVIKMLDKVDELKKCSSEKELRECFFFEDLKWKIDFYIEHIIPSCVVLNESEESFINLNFEKMVLEDNKKEV